MGIEVENEARRATGRMPSLLPQHRLIMICAVTLKCPEEIYATGAHSITHAIGCAYTPGRPLLQTQRKRSCLQSPTGRGRLCKAAMRRFAEAGFKDGESHGDRADGIVTGQSGCPPSRWLSQSKVRCCRQD